MGGFFAKITVLAAATGLALQAGAAQASVRFICPSYDPATKTLSVKVGSGCMTGMARLKDQNLQLTVNEDRAAITVSGDITFHNLESFIVTADCAGAKTFTLTQSGIEPRRYSLSYGANQAWTYDLLPEAPPQQDCLWTRRGARASPNGGLDRSRFGDWHTDQDGKWRDWSGDSVIALLRPILGNFPESVEGGPEVSIEMEKAQWQPSRWKPADSSSRDFIAVRIERDGFGDDSVSGDRYFVAVKQTDNGWKVDALWRQNMCARGPFAGQWTKATCP